MFSVVGLQSYFKEVTGSLKFQLSAAITFGVALLLVWNAASDSKVYLTILFLFPACMFLGSIIEKIIRWREVKKEKKDEMMKGKLGLLGQYQFTDRLNDLWPDQDYKGLAWQILVEVHQKQAFLTEPVCLVCQTNLIIRTNMTCDGFYLECTDCKARFEVDDIGKARSLANSSLQGEARRNPNRFFYW